MRDQALISRVADEVKAGKSAYLNAKHCEEGRTIRVVQWLFNAQPVEAILYKEGWAEFIEHDARGKPSTHKKPVRFMPDQEITEHKWCIGEGFGDKPGKPQTPQWAVAFICWDYKDNAFRLASFSQQSIVKNFTSFLDANSEFCIDDLTVVDIVIGKKKGENVYTVTTKPQKNTLPDNFNEQAASFLCSLEDYMDGLNPFDENSTRLVSYGDVMHRVAQLSGGATVAQTQKPAATQPAAQQAAKPATANNNVSDWRKVQTPTGAELGGFDLEKLKRFKDFMDGNGSDKNSKVYLATLTGIKELSQPVDEAF